MGLLAPWKMSSPATYLCTIQALYAIDSIWNPWCIIYSCKSAFTTCVLLFAIVSTVVIIKKLCTWTRSNQRDPVKCVNGRVRNRQNRDGTHISAHQYRTRWIVIMFYSFSTSISERTTCDRRRRPFIRIELSVHWVRVIWLGGKVAERARLRTDPVRLDSAAVRLLPVHSQVRAQAKSH